MKKLFFLLVFLMTTNTYAAVDAFHAGFSAMLSDENGTATELDDATTTFSIGEQAIIFARFDTPVKISGGNAWFNTNIPVIGDADAASTGAEILSFTIDGNELDISGSQTTKAHVLGDYLSIEIEPHIFANAEPFTMMEILFVVNNPPRGVEDIQNEPIEIEIEPIITEQVIELGEPVINPNESESFSPFWSIVIIIAVSIGVGVAIFLINPNRAK